MSWDSSLPSNTTKMRQYPTVLTNNFVQIEQGADNGDVISLQQWQVNFIQRTSIPGNPPPSLDPTTTANTITFYSKLDNNAQMFIRDDQANIIQLTQDGKLGAVTQSVAAADFQMDAGTPIMTFGVNQMIMAHGSFNATGALLNGINFAASAAPVGTGLFDINVSADILLNVNYRVFGTVTLAGASQRIIQVVTKGVPVGATVTTIRVRVMGNTTGHDLPFDILVVGGR